MREAVNPLRLVDQPGIARARRDGLAAEKERSRVVHRAATKLATVGERPARGPLLGEAPTQAVARALFRDARRAGLLPLEALEIGADRPAGIRWRAQQRESENGENPHHMRSIIAWPKPEQDTCFAPCIWRAKS